MQIQSRLIEVQEELIGEKSSTSTSSSLFSAISTFVAKKATAEQKALFGTQVTHTDPYHRRGASTGVIEDVNDLTGEFIVRWLEDGSEQVHPSFRSYSLSQLILTPNH